MIVVTHNGAAVTKVENRPKVKAVHSKFAFGVANEAEIPAMLAKLKLAPMPTPEEIAREAAAMAVIAEGSLVEKENFALARGLPDEKKVELTDALRGMLAR